MERENRSDKGFLAIDCLSGQVFHYGDNLEINKAGQLSGDNKSVLPYAGPGLIDLQINGINGIDFNSVSLNCEGMVSAANYLLSKGVTTFFPTVITNTEENTRYILSVINEACHKNALLDRCIGGIHLEGPFISPADGYRGAHNKDLVRAPDWNLFLNYQKVSGGRIKIITLSPEWENSTGFIKKCREEGLLATIAHSRATPVQINASVDAGVALASHIGNGLPLEIPRHPNVLWEILASEKIYISLIADGFHLPDSFIRVVLKVKMDKAILVSDATCFSGLAPGVYKSPIGSEVLLEANGRLSMNNGRGLLAGATRTLLENVQYMVCNNLADLRGAWYMASAGPRRLIKENIHLNDPGDKDLVLFNYEEGEIVVSEVFKNGKSAWRRQDRPKEDSLMD
ncbi:MAG: N-acetylglucosamine-6-phosphate deacetylase [Bacteroidales bacterium]